MGMGTGKGCRAVQSRNCHRVSWAAHQFSSVQLSRSVRIFVTPWTAARQASLFITNSWSLLRLRSIELVTSSSHLILCCPLLFSPLIFPSVRVFSNESDLLIRWPKYWSFSFHISPSYEYSGRIYSAALLICTSSLLLGQNRALKCSCHAGMEVVGASRSVLFRLIPNMTTRGQQRTSLCVFLLKVLLGQ